MMLLTTVSITIVVAVAIVGDTGFALNNGLGMTPPLGWSSWCAYGECYKDYCNEAEVLATAKAMQANGMQAAGYNWMILDDCWANDGRTAAGDLTWDVNRFPHGIPNLTATLHNMGFKFGLYTSAGNQTCSSGGRPKPIPGSEGHYQRDMNTFASWDIDYVKVDWCGDVQKMPLDGIKVGAKDYKAVSAAITNTTPAKAMYLEGVAAYLFLLYEAPMYVNSWRASTDHHDNWHNTVMVITSAYDLDLAKPAPGGWAYMDVLMTGGAGCPSPAPPTAHCPGMTDVEYTTEFTLWSLMQSPLVVATNVRNMTAIMNKTLFNKYLLQAHQDTRTPPGRMIGYPEGCNGKFFNIRCTLFGRTMHDGSAILVMLNGGFEAHNITYDLDKIFPKGTMSATGVNVWTGQNVTVTDGKFTDYVESHGVSAVWLTPSPSN